MMALRQLKNINPRPFMATIDPATSSILRSSPIETLSSRGLRISELVAVARIFKLLIYPGDFVPRENGEFVAEGLPMSHFARFLTKLSAARFQQG